MSNKLVFTSGRERLTHLEAGKNQFDLPVMDFLFKNTGSERTQVRAAILLAVSGCGIFQKSCEPLRSLTFCVHSETNTAHAAASRGTDDFESGLHFDMARSREAI